MRKKFLLIILMISLISGGCSLKRINQEGITPSPSPTGHPALEILGKYQELNSDVNLVIPYIINLMAIDLLKINSNSNHPLVKNYIEWYLDHVNYPDKYGTTGSIYDYQVYSDGTEISLDSFDSIDSYAATFIILVNLYHNLSGDDIWIQSNRQILEDIIYLIPFLQQEDGLTVAIPNTTGKYLMDNCEALGGLSAYLELSEKMNWDVRNYYQNLRQNLLNAIENYFFNPERMNYYWLIDGNIKTPSNWEIFYPDAFAQLFPILYTEVLSKTLKTNLWNRFHQTHGSILDEIPVEQKIIYQWTKEVIDSEI